VDRTASVIEGFRNGYQNQSKIIKLGFIINIIRKQEIKLA